MTDVGSVVYDKDATFLEVGGSSKDSLSQYGIEDKRTPLLNELKGIQLKERDEDELQLFAGSAPIAVDAFVSVKLLFSGLMTENTSDASHGVEESVAADGRIRRRVVFKNEAADIGSGDDDDASDDDGDDGQEGAPARGNEDSDQEDGELEFEETDSELSEDGDQDGQEAEEGEDASDDENEDDIDEEDELDDEAEDDDGGSSTLFALLESIALQRMPNGRTACTSAPRLRSKSASASTCTS